MHKFNEKVFFLLSLY